MTQLTHTTNLMTDIDKRFQVGNGFPPVRYISGDEVTYLRSRVVTLRGKAFQSLFAKMAGLFRSQPVQHDCIDGPAVTAK